MPRRRRIDFPGAWHHVMNRGARRADVFRCRAEYELFLEHIGEVSRATELEVHAYALMPNHFHLLVRTENGTLSHAMRRLTLAYVTCLRRDGGFDGPVFRGRFRSELVGDDRYLMELVAYLHLNPVRAGLVDRASAAPWTSHRAHVRSTKAPDWLYLDPVAELMGPPAAIDAFVLSRTGEEAPTPPIVPTRTRVVVPQMPSPPPSPGRLLDAVAQLTRVEVRSLYVSSSGPPGNAPRRLALWGLVVLCQLSHEAAGALLQASPSVVSTTVRRMRSGVEHARFRHDQAQLARRLGLGPRRPIRR